MASQHVYSHNFVSTPNKPERQTANFLLDGVTPLQMEKLSSDQIPIEDVPIPSPRKDFHALLEERLKDSETTVIPNAIVTTKTRIKKPFLRKGEGLARFRLNRDNVECKPIARTCSGSLSASTRINSRSSKNQVRKEKDGELKSTQAHKTLPNTSLAPKQLCLKNVPKPSKKVRSNSESSFTLVGPCAARDTKNTATDLNGSDFDTKTLKEMEETRIFELLEEKAENSSFCSTSSAVLAFLQQSTPFKKRNDIHGALYSPASAKQQSPLLKRSVFCHQFRQAHAFISNNKSHGPEYYELPKTDNNLPVYNEPGKCSGNDNIVDAASVQTVAQKSSEWNQNRENDYKLSESVAPNELDVSLHVRFSEFNEYKTIGLTDTSSISNESITLKEFADDKTWDDTPTPDDGSDTDTSCSVAEKLQFREATTMLDKAAHSESGDMSNSEFEDYKEQMESDITDQTSDSEQKITVNSNNKGNSRDNGQVDKIIASNSNDAFLKSELLKTRLLELEEEIDVFRKENAALSQQRRRLQEDHAKLYKEFAEKEKQLEENRRHTENQLQEERKKLARERTALECRMKAAQEKALQSRLERQEMQNLKEALDQLREEMNSKESRWNAAQSRHRCQVRILKMENEKLKQEIERLQSTKKTNSKNKMRCNTSNTKAIHQINKELNMENKENYKNSKGRDSDDEQKCVKTKSPAECIEENTKQNSEKQETHDINQFDVYEMLKPSDQNTSITKKRVLYEQLLKEATLDLTQIDVATETKDTSVQKPEVVDVHKADGKGKLATMRKTPNKSSIPLSDASNNIQMQLFQPEEREYLSHIHKAKTPQKQETKLFLKTTERLSDMSQTKSVRTSNSNSITTNKQDGKQVHHPDGRVEFWYPNGNVKKIFPDQGITKIIYYNGDVCETDKDGKIKYFYASTCTWHTTMPDGLEILEFPDGQIERRSKNGTVEVSFPDGSIRVVQSDGTEKWALPDGTTVQTFLNGEKILLFPNGQREIHTKNHKRREYPDGTIKLVYLDGTQETQYSNGRVRLKDKDGNLLMDSHEK